MIKAIVNAVSGETQYKVRVFVKSTEHPGLRITKQKGGFKSLAEARKEEQKLKKDCSRELMETEARGILFGELVTQWHWHQLKVRVAKGLMTSMTQEDNRAALLKWFGEFEKRPAIELNPYQVISIFERMKEEGLSGVRRKKLKQILKSVFDFGIQSGALPTVQRSPTFEVILKRDEEKKPEILSMAEIQKLVTKAFEESHPWKRIWAAALMTGMRSGELYALSWSDVNFEDKVITVHRSYNCRFRQFKSTKGGYWRQIPISGELEKILIDQKADTGSEEHVFPRHWEWFRGDQARVLRAFCFLHNLPSIKFHTLRACFATQMLRSGVETARVMKIGGWKDLKTMQLYVRLAGIEIHGATENLKIFGNRNHEGEASASPSFLPSKNESNPLVPSPGVTVVGHTLDTRFCNPSS